MSTRLNQITAMMKNGKTTNKAKRGMTKMTKKSTKNGNGSSMKTHSKKETAGTKTDLEEDDPQ